MVKIGFWNVRGIVRQNIYIEIKDHCKANKINILALCETKSKNPPNMKAIIDCGFQNYDYIPTVGFSGGIWLLWKGCRENPFSLEVIKKDQRFIAANIIIDNYKFTILFIYAPAQNNQKDYFWRTLIDYVNQLNSPFVIMGDFNDISKFEDKVGGAPPNLKRLERMQHLVSHTNTVELPFEGPSFTWRKKRAGPNNIMEKIDNCVVSVDWLDRFPFAKILNSHFMSSDHSMISLNLNNDNFQKASPFKLEKMWCSHHSFPNIVRKAWGQNFQGSYMFCLVKKCKTLKQFLKEWNKKNFGNIFRQIREIDTKLNQVQQLIILQPNNKDLSDKQEKLYRKRKLLLSWQDNYWKQKAKINNTQLLDTNTKFFHTHATIRKNRNYITKIVSQNGTEFNTQFEISRALTQDFKSRFTSNPHCSFDINDLDLLEPIISNEENLDLTKNVTQAEIEEAVYQLAPDKSPGPDGFPPFFFQENWAIVGNSVFKAIKAFFYSGRLLKQINHTFLVLIPKSENPQTSNQFRPISLCSTIYKIISKILVNRLKKVLGKIIHPLQGAFTPERLIQDNILLAHEIFHSFGKKQGKEGWIAIKLDMEKAYDRLEWKYIEATLIKLGFHTKWVNWVKECYTTVSYSVLVNGYPSTQFFPTRGIRQGDPLSPYLFILCAELLARLFQRQCKQPKSNIGVSPGHSKTKIPFLTFADDTMIFAKANVHSCHKIKEILDKYCRISGQLVNYHKSAFQCTSNVSESEKILFKQILQMEETSDLESYLGCPIIEKRATNAKFDKVLVAAKSQLTKWKANSLSQAGRKLLINSNLATKANYQMQSFLLPKIITTKLDKIYREFLWNKDQNDKTPNLISWDKICKPKALGGLGLRKARIMNIAFQLKLLWKIFSNDNSLWVQMIKRKYLKNKGLFDYKIPSSVSWQWRNLMKIRPIFKKGIRWQVGDGSKINFWNDNWILPYPLKQVVQSLSINENIKVAEFIDYNKQWKKRKLEQVLPHWIVNLILTIPIPTNSVPDRALWGPASDGQFSVKSAALLAQGIYPDNNTKCPFHWIWKLNVTPKIQFFLWKICVDALPTKDRLYRSRITVPITCQFCNHQMEDITHLLFKCSYGKDVIKCISQTEKDWITPRYDDNYDIINNLCLIRANIGDKQFASLATGWWFIWLARNSVVFQNMSIPVQTTVKNILMHIQNWKHEETEDGIKANVNNLFKKRVRVNYQNIWMPPNYGQFKLNFDGSKIGTHSTALGFIIRDHIGNIKIAGAKALHPESSIILAEAMALKEGIRQAIRLEIQDLIIEGDNLTVINAVRRIWKIPWEIHNIIEDIKIDLGSFRNYYIQHCYREINQAADYLAHLGHQHPILKCWFSNFQNPLVSIVRKDALGWSYPGD